MAATAAVSLRRLLSKSSLSRTLTTTSHNRAWFFAKEKEKTSGHSTLLSKDQSVYEMVTDTVIPREWDHYLATKKQLVQCMADNKDNKGTLVGSWTIVTGDALFKVSNQNEPTEKIVVPFRPFISTNTRAGPTLTRARRL